jgi:exonuclease I
MPSTRKNRLSFREARKYVRNLNLKNNKEWREYCKSGKKPDTIPVNPDREYRDEGWIDWNDWLGTDNKPTRRTVYRSFIEAREFVRKLRLENQHAWREYCKSGKKPIDIPANPARTYKE